MSFYVYILECSDGSYYVGHTDNLEARIAAHRMGVVERYTGGRGPVELVFSEDCVTRQDAFERNGK